MRYDPRHNTTDYVIASAENQSVCSIIKRMLFQMFPPTGAHPSMHLRDPFAIHALIADELYIEAENVARHLRYRLYTALAKVRTFSNARRHTLKSDDENNREDPKALTLELHEISQDRDLMLANGDMALRLNAAMQRTHLRFESQVHSQPVTDDYRVRDASAQI